jgi:hypothetical protein
VECGSTGLATRTIFLRINGVVMLDYDQTPLDVDSSFSAPPNGYAGLGRSVMGDSGWVLVGGYARPPRAVLAQRREHKARPITEETISAMIAHEALQPLSAAITCAEAGLRWLDRGTPDIEEAKTALKQIIIYGGRAAVAIEALRADFKKDAEGTSGAGGRIRDRQDRPRY